jgi:DNA-binding LacI/PurR family transcriptional regulator
MRQMVKHVADLRHKRVAFVQSSAKDHSFTERQAGFEQGCAELGLQSQVWPLPTDWQGIESELKRHLIAKDRPTAVLACNDEHALAVIRAAREVGLRVPQDLSVAGFDDIDAAAHHQPTLTTMRVDKQAMGLQAIQTVFRLLEPPLEPSGRVELPVALVARHSTGIAPE